MSDPVLEASLRNLAAWSLQVGVLALVAAVLSRLVPIERPQARLAFGQVLLVLVVALPLLQPWRSAAADVGWSLALTPLGASPSPSSDGASSSALTPAWPAVVAGLLLLGLAAQLTRLGVGLVRIRSLAPPWPRLGRPPGSGRAPRRAGAARAFSRLRRDEHARHLRVQPAR